MKRALVTFAVGGYVDLLDISRPTFEHYAEKHGYKYIEWLPSANRWNRPPAWFRIPILQEELPNYDAVLCMGADMIIVDSSEDIADAVRDDSINAMVGHRSPWGFVPSTEMMYMKPAMLPWLDRAWGLGQYKNHPWWEQAAINHLMGFNPAELPMKHIKETELYQLTHFLPLEWHSHESLDRHDSPRFVEATHGKLDWRRDVLLRYREIADCS